MSALLSLLEGLDRSTLSAGLRSSDWLYPLVNALHIVGIALLVGPILILDWRVLRRSQSPTVSILAAVLLPAARTGFALALVAGILLFTARPLDYAFNTLFQIKLACIVLALLNIAVLHRSKAWGFALTANQPDWRVRLACGFSLVFWLTALGLGRLVGYR